MAWYPVGQRVTIAQSAHTPHGTVNASFRFPSARRSAKSVQLESMPRPVAHAVASLALWDSSQQTVPATVQRLVRLGLSRITELLAFEAAPSAVQGTSRMVHRLAKSARQDFTQR